MATRPQIIFPPYIQNRSVENTRNKIKQIHIKFRSVPEIYLKSIYQRENSCRLLRGREIKKNIMSTSRWYDAIVREPLLRRAFTLGMYVCMYVSYILKYIHIYTSVRITRFLRGLVLSQ